MDEQLLTIKNLSVGFQTEAGLATAVDHISFNIRRGETFALLGESGCGKSMTALSIMQLLPPSARLMAKSAICLGEQDLTKLPEVAMRNIRGQKIAMIFQEPMTSLNPVMTVAEQIAEVLRAHLGLVGAALRAKIVELLDAVGIPDPSQRMHEYPHQLSGGMKQRVMIAMALAGEPDLLIADEPTTALDVTIQAQVLSLLKDLQAKNGMAILLITHDLGVVKQTADRLAVMYAGHIVETADCATFFKAPKHPYSIKLFASIPSMTKRDKPLSVIKGYVPPLTKTFTQCRFLDRCEYSIDICQQHLPVWEEGDNAVRCHLHDASEIKPKLVDEAVIESVRASDPGILLQVKDLKVHFPIQKGIFKQTVAYVKAVDGVDLELKRGRTLAIVGESGSGKTTAGRGILQLLKPTAGTVQFEGHELTSLGHKALHDLRRDMQIIFQDPFSSMNPRMMVGDIIAEGMIAQKTHNKAERDARVEELLQQVGLTQGSKLRYPHEFSGGQRQRIAIARALALKPKLIICDEPTSALDVSVQAQILNLLKDLQNELGLAYLFITHDLSVVSYLADEVAVMYLGRVVERGTVEEVINNPKHPYTQALLSAVPVVDEPHGREIIKLGGEMPSPINPPVGCHFHPRCPQASGDCQRSYPGSIQLSDSHRVHCVLYS